MNNKHQEQIAEKVAEFANQHPKRLAEILTFFEKALQDTIDTVVAEQRSSIKIDSSDMQKVGDHYWGGDYEPTYYELEKLTESMNEILQTKLKALDNTPPNKV